MPIPSRIRAALLGVLTASAAITAQAQDFAAIDAAIAGGGYGPIRSLLVHHRGQLVHEAYFRGSGRDDLQLLNSVTKSIGATLVGIAVRQQLFEPSATIDTLLPQYDWQAPDLSGSRGLRLDHLLQMRHGLLWDEWSYAFVDPRNSHEQMVRSGDWYRFVLSRPRVEAPDSRFRYSTGTANLMSAVLQRATGKPAQQLFAEWLASPLDIERFDWELWSPDGPGRGLRTFPNDNAPLGVGLWLRPLDLLKIGQLYLDGGVYGGRRLLDREWIDASWTAYSHNGNDPHFATSASPRGYGLQWWFIELTDAGGRTHACWYADGYARQYLVVCPTSALIAVSTGDAYAATAPVGPGLFTLLREQILPALRHPIGAHLSGFYFDPASSGQGLSLEVSEPLGQVLAAWYTYADGQHRWYTMLGRIDGDRVTFDAVLRTEGGRFLASDPVSHASVGRATLWWESCQHAVLEYEIELGAGEYHVQRLTPGC
jgi:CubicO group peptidase (beta-lactamase class C family)